MPQPCARVTGALMLAGLTVLGSPWVASQGGPFGPIRVAVNRSQYVGSCPVDIVFTGTINFTMPHPQGLTFNYYWERSDGAKTPVRIVRPQDSQRSSVVRETWHLGAAGQKYSASTTLFVNSGNSHGSQASPVVNVTGR
jgi:hypothetical protein